MRWPRWLRRLGFGPCPHRWRPAVSERRHAARYCELCEGLELLTVPDFYAYFGRMPW